MLARADIPVVDIPFVSIGGGIGSFVTVDYLRICGVPTSAIRVFTQLETPWESYEYLTRVSPDPARRAAAQRLGVLPGQHLGLPELRRARGVRDEVAQAAGPDRRSSRSSTTTTRPKAGQAFESMEQEYHRIRYPETVVKGQVRMVRRRIGRRLLHDPHPARRAPRAPTGRVPQPLRARRRRLPGAEVPPRPHGLPGDPPRLRQRRQRLRAARADLRAAAPGAGHRAGPRRRHRRLPRAAAADRRPRRARPVRPRSCTSSAPTSPARTARNLWMRRRGGDGWAYQGFNYPKSVWGGQLKASACASWRARSGPTSTRCSAAPTPRGAAAGRRQLRRGRRRAGTGRSRARSRRCEPGPHGTVAGRAEDRDGTSHAQVTGVIDCTGLEADIREHRVLADLLDHGGAGRNPLGRLDVERTFEVRGTRSEPGRMYASGTATLGGYFPGVDTFLGLQIAAQEIADDLARAGLLPEARPDALDQPVVEVGPRGEDLRS